MFVRRLLVFFTYPISTISFALSSGVYYKTCGTEELAAFLASPEEYLPPISVRRLPEDPDYLPKKRDRAWAKHQFPQQVVTEADDFYLLSLQCLNCLSLFTFFIRVARWLFDLTLKQPT